MSGGSGRDAGDDSDATRFARALNTLKQEGSALLVVGVVPDDMYERASQQMLGNGRAADPRRRAVVTDDPAVGDRLSRTGPTTPEFARIVAIDSAARSAAAASSAPSAGGSTAGPGVAKAHFVGSSFGELGQTVTDVIEQFEVAAGELSPAELRVAVDCLPSLLDEYDEETVFRFLHVLTYQVRSRRGMAHVRLPRPVDDRTVLTFGALFDVIIELRVDGDALKQRWRFVDEDFVSEWLSMRE